MGIIIETDNKIYGITKHKNRLLLKLSCVQYMEAFLIVPKISQNKKITN